MKWIILFISPILILSSKNWILIWGFLEISSFSFILIAKKENSSESLMKYFLIQTISSIFLLSSIMMKSVDFSSKSFMMTFTPNILLLISLLVKSGVAPFHIWMPQISKNLSWNSILIFLTIQKLSPMFLIISFNNLIMISSLIVLSSIVGTVSQLITSNLKILMTYSSISHSGWMLMGGLKNMNIFMFYFLIYSFLSIQIINSFKYLNMIFISKMSKNFNILILLLSLGGMPPLLGFLPKWIIISSSSTKDFMILLILISMACLNIYIYVKISSSNLTKTISKKNEKSMKNEENFLFPTLNISFTPFLFMIMK